MTSENDSGHKPSLRLRLKQSLTPLRGYKISKYNRRQRLEAEKGAMIYNPALPYIDRTLKRKRRDKRRAEIVKKALKKFK